MHHTVYEYISAQLKDPIIEWRTCAWTGEKFAITEADKAFYEKVSPIFAGQKYPIPFPTLSPEARHQRRSSFGNWSYLYERVCDFSWKKCIGQFPAEADVVVYDRAIWDSDVWDARDFSKNYDEDRSFFSQIQDLFRIVPRPHNMSFSCENSIYSLCTFSRDCYLLLIGGECENTHYSEWVLKSKDSLESADSSQLEQSYECIEVTKAYNCSYLVKSEECRSVHYSVAMKGCTDCFLCSGLTNQSYCIRNVPYTKEVYYKTLSTLMSQGSYFKNHSLFQELRQLIEKTPLPATKVIGSEVSFGTIIENCMQVVFGTHATESQRCKYGFLANFHNKDCYDTSSYYSSLCLESVSGGPTHHCLFCFELRENCQDLLYCAYTLNCRDCFGCVWLKNAQYCILNKQYTKEQYESIIPRVINAMIRDREWGEFFDPKFAIHSYDRSEAQLYRALDDDNSLYEKFLWYETAPVRHEGIRSIPANQLPDSIHDTPDDVLNWAIECELTKKPFRLIAQELAFYRKHNLPIPRVHPEIRRLKRREYRSGSDFFLRHDEQWPFLCVYAENSATSYLRIKNEKPRPQNPPFSLCEESVKKAHI